MGVNPLACAGVGVERVFCRGCVVERGREVGAMNEPFIPQLERVHPQPSARDVAPLREIMFRLFVYVSLAVVSIGICWAVVLLWVRFIKWAVAQ